MPREGYFEHENILKECPGWPRMGIFVKYLGSRGLKNACLNM